jgi:DNA polymerase I-like protein with 3'-5' exonuclease and polymerase domains
VPDDAETIEAAKKIIRSLMEDSIPMSVPLTVSMDEAKRWGEAK